MAYHVVPSRKPLPAVTMPTVIIKFLPFHKKTLVMKNRRKRKGIKNPLNEKYIYINEPLGPVEQYIFSATEKRGHILTSRNFKISVLCFKTVSDEKELVRSDYLNDLDKLKNPIKKQARQNINNTPEWKRTHDRMEATRVQANSYESE